MRRVLMVDDDSDIRELLTVFLTGEGFEVLTACDGQEALDLLKQEHDSLVVLLDLLMPHDGPNVLAWLEAVQRLDHHKVVVMSASASLPEGQDLLSRGSIAAFLPKPFDLNELLALVQQLTASNTPS